MSSSKEKQPSRLRVPSRGLFLGLAAPVSLAVLAACGGGDSGQSSFEDQFKSGSQATETPLPPSTNTLFATATSENSTPVKDGRYPFTEIGEVASDLQLPDRMGNLIKLSDFSGKPLIVQFREKQCGPCDRDADNLRNLFTDFAGSDLQILTVYVGISPNYPGIEEESWPVLFDQNNAINANQYFFDGFPTTIFIDREGRLREQFTGSWYYRGLTIITDQLIRGEQIVSIENLQLDDSLLGLPIRTYNLSLFSVGLFSHLNEVADIPLADAKFVEDQIAAIAPYLSYEISPYDGNDTEADNINAILDKLAATGENLAANYCRSRAQIILDRLINAAEFGRALYFKYTQYRLLNIELWPQYASRFNPDCIVEVLPTRN